MEINRKDYQKLLKWKKETQGQKALLIEGARRIGKSTLAEKFGEREYKSCIVIDFNKVSKRIKDNFDENLNNPDIFFQTISLEYNKPLYKRDSLIVFDEIQKFPKAREAIKYLVADGRYDYIETGSLISIKENVRDITIPSEERKLKMYPCDFEEFADALGERILLGYIKECWQKKEPLDQKFHAKAMRLFREYMLVGGMPQSIVTYAENNRDFTASDVEKRDILELYRDDIKKAAVRYKSKISALFENIPGYLSTHEKKVNLAAIDSGSATFERYDDPFFWLDDSMICNLCYKCNDPTVGFALNKNDSRLKCYMGDTGLLVSLAFSENAIASTRLYHAIMEGRLSLNEGMLYENIIAQMLRCKGKKLYFYNEYDEKSHRNKMEVDFLLSNESKTNFKIFPVEVKSSKNYTTSSLTLFREKFGKKIETSYIIHPKSLQIEENLIKLPPYMIWCME
ncbi:ATP-binding protein [bacterium]|nr:ATP-binding protein [bacterium]